MSVAVREIQSRCQACGSLLGRPTPAPEPATLAYGPLVLDLARRTASVGGLAQEFPMFGPGDAVWPLLVAMVKAAGRPLSVQEIREALYGRHSQFTAHSARQARMRLRAKLAPLGVRLVVRAGAGAWLEVDE